MRAETALRAVRVVLVVAVVAAAVFTFVTRRSQARAAEAARAHRPVATRTDGYVSSQQCRACHPEQYESWHRSYHRTMTQVASPEAILADFDDVELELDGQRHALGHEGDASWFEMPAADGSGMVRRKISLVTGSHHMQVYWFEIESSRWLGQVPFSYLTEERRWIPRRAAFLRPPDKLRGSDLGRWNSTCVHCHATHGQPRIAGQTADTHVAEFGIACEACHGPAQAHVRANTLPLRRYASYFSDASDDTIVQPRDLSHEKASEVCAQCHGLWQMHDAAAMQRALVQGQAYRPGGTHEGQYLFQPSQRDTNPVIADIVRDAPEYVAGQFWGDGMARASSREYHGMIESGCYEDGEMSCLSCHTMHKKADDPRSLAAWADDQLGAGMDGDGACTQCHRDIGKAVEQHTFHPAASEGSRCYNCHMPYTSYGLLKAIRSHQVSSPDVASTVTHGRPNACNLCHLDRSLGWAADALKTRWGIAPPPLDADQAAMPAGALWALKGDAGQRALVAWHMGWSPARQTSRGGWFVPLLGELLDDPYDAVRIVAGRALPKHRGFEDFAFDPVPRPWSRSPAAPGVVARWHEVRGEGPHEPAPAPAFTPSGERDEAVFTRLLRERDQKAVHLLE